MARISCKYHPAAPARWRCPACAIDLCPACVKSPERARDAPTCLACKGALTSLGIGNSIPPFWERIPRFFAYPAKADALVYLAGLSLLTVLAVVPLAGLIVYLVVSYAILKYGYLVLGHTARGNLEPPMLLGRAAGADGNLPLKQMVVFMLMAFIVGAVAAFAGEALGAIVLLAMLFSIPASIMSMAIDGNIGKAVDPTELAPIIARIGLPYLILYVFLLLLMGGSAFAQGLLAAALPPWLVIVTTTFVSGYFTAIMFNMMGYVVYQYHEALGFEGVREAKPAPAAAPAGGAPAPVADPFETEIAILVNEGRIDEARDRLEARLKGFNATLADRERYHRLLQASGDRERSTAHGRELVQMLVGQGDGSRALTVYGECLTLDRGFALADAGRTHKLATLAHEQGRDELALRMLSGFAQRFPSYPNIPEAYLLAARLLCEHAGEDAKALAVLDGLLARYPGHAIEAELVAYREIVVRVLGGTAGELIPST